MSVALVDDRTLSRILRGEVPAELSGFTFATTGCWYVRLCTAVLSPKPWHGTLSGAFAQLPPLQRSRARMALHRLPDEIALPSMRELGPAIGELRARRRLNLLGLEVLAAAQHLDAQVVLSTPSPRLQAALEEEGLTCRQLTDGQDH